MKIYERRLQEISGSILVTLPKKWADQFKLKKGSTVEISETEKKLLQISPKIENTHEKSREVIEFDKNFIRRFFRLYLSGTDEIVITKQKPFELSEKQVIQKSLDCFMNVQIIEDHPQKIVIQNFDIHDLSINQCLRRMYFLTKNMFNGILGMAEDIDTIDTSLHKFYFLLVRLIRKDLDEGHYIEKKMQLIRYLDYRMVSEKIERVGDILKKLAKENKNKQVIEQLKYVEKLYESAFNTFIKEDFEDAISLWNKRDDFGKKYKNPNPDVEEIHNFAIQISKFVR
ncbi:phosphate uptake regulator PhoU [Candidatus Woesearchaeota archaeon]|jgi:phosphate uptake regulator|nr:phosphate uptake regulator PhoU [Candidatus Woesearchaeota archaeon]MBT6519169.1 phosphate uptake regulator PhoU [Candidatus Woesearchaeota archaeon]MBT7367281.1 phosphate uptake regulator PhoU [Candidatus Woesearchaeota archaeon]